MITTTLLDQAKLTGQVERTSTGAMGAGVTALHVGGVAMTYVNEPVWSSRAFEESSKMREKDRRQLPPNRRDASIAGYTAARAI